jgi:thioredoxin-like negative regulator of GroEL
MEDLWFRIVNINMGTQHVDTFFIYEDLYPERDLAELKQAMVLDPGSHYARLAYAFQLQSMKDVDEAIVIYKALANEDTGDVGLAAKAEMQDQSARAELIDRHRRPTPE